MFPITEDWEFVILACDGIWDVLLSIDAVEFIRQKLVDLVTINPEEICEDLLDHCLAPDALMGTGCDNMTVIIVVFLHGKPQSHIIRSCKRQFISQPSTVDQFSSFQ